MISIKIERTAKPKKEKQTKEALVLTDQAPTEENAKTSNNPSEEKQGLFKRLKKRFEGISFRKSIDTLKESVSKRKTKTYVVSFTENPTEYEYVEATSASDAIAKSAYVDKELLQASVRPQYNCYVVDEVVGCYPCYIEPNDVAKIKDARMYYFNEFGTYLYFLYNKYDTNKVTSSFIAWERIDTPKLTPDELFDAITWTDLIKEAFKPHEIVTLDKLNPTILLGLIGCLILLIVIFMG